MPARNHNGESQSKRIDEAFKSYPGPKYKLSTRLSEATGASPQAVGQWRRRGAVSYDNLVSLSDLLGVSINWILTGRGEMRDGEPKIDEVRPLTPAERARARSYESKGGRGPGRPRQARRKVARVTAPEREKRDQEPELDDIAFPGDENWRPNNDVVWHPRDDALLQPVVLLGTTMYGAELERLGEAPRSNDLVVLSMQRPGSYYAVHIIEEGDEPGVLSPPGTLPPPLNRGGYVAIVCADQAPAPGFEVLVHYKNFGAHSQGLGQGRSGLYTLTWAAADRVALTPLAGAAHCIVEERYMLQAIHPVVGFERFDQLGHPAHAA